MPSTKVSFTSSKGFLLSGTIEWSLQQSNPFAIIAHCFTCSQQSHGALRLARILNQQGINVLRFDFTGVGRSQGQLNDSDYAANIDDLVSASQYLKKTYIAPSLLIGHSLGGTAAISASHLIPEIKALVTIGSPYNPASIKKYIIDEQITADTKPEQKKHIKIAGETFLVDQNFLKSFEGKEATEAIRNLNKPILIVHSAIDEIVPIDDAINIFKLVSSPKNFITLDKADHLLTRRVDAEYLGSVISSWAKQYIKHEDIKTKAHHSPSKGLTVSVCTTLNSLTQSIGTATHSLIADEPKKMGGDDLGPSPYEFLLASLGSCTAMTMQMYARNKKWPLEKIKITLSHKKEEHTSDDMLKKQKIDVIERNIVVEGDLDQKQQSRLLEIADRCPVHRTLKNSPKIETKLVRSN